MYSVAFSPNGQTLATGRSTGYMISHGEVNFWRVADGSPLKSYDQETGAEVFSFQLSPNAGLLGYGRDDATVVVARNPLAPKADCRPDARLTAECRNGGQQVLGTLKKGIPNTPVAFTLDDGHPVERTTNDRGKAKARYTRQAPGPHTVRACGLEADC